MKTKLMLKTGLVGVIIFAAFLAAGAHAYAYTINATITPAAGGSMKARINGGAFTNVDPGNPLINIPDGASVDFFVEANNGYYNDYVTADGRKKGITTRKIGADGYILNNYSHLYYFPNVKEDHAINVYFREIPDQLSPPYINPSDPPGTPPTVVVTDNPIGASTEFEELVEDRKFNGAVFEVVPGTIILVAPGNYSFADGSKPKIYLLNGVNGTESAPITVRGLDPNNPPVFSNGVNFWVENTSYLIIRDLVIQDMDTGKENSIRAYGSKVSLDELSPTHHIVFENLTIVNTGGAWGNHDALKISNLDYFTVRGCYFEGWAEQAIDMIASQHVVIEDNQFTGAKIGPNRDSNSFEDEFATFVTKGGSRDFLIHRNIFHNAGNQGLVIGGFGYSSQRSPVGSVLADGTILDYEGSDIEIAGNRIFADDSGDISIQRPLTLKASNNTLVHRNTFYANNDWPPKGMIQIIGTVGSAREAGVQSSRNGEFSNNLFVFQQIPTYRLINQPGSGPVSYGSTFEFTRNAWYNPDPQSGDVDDTYTSIKFDLDHDGIPYFAESNESNEVYGFDPELDMNPANPTYLYASQLWHDTYDIGADAYEFTDQAGGGIIGLPDVIAGTGQSITFSLDRFSLSGSVGSLIPDPNPPGLIKIMWRQISGPGKVIFHDVSSPTSSVTFPAASETEPYVLELNAYYGGEAETDTVEITVNPDNFQHCTLTVTANGNGIVTQNPLPSTDGYHLGQIVTLTPVGQNGHVFYGWLEGDIPVAYYNWDSELQVFVPIRYIWDKDLQIVMATSKTITANFNEIDLRAGLIGHWEFDSIYPEGSSIKTADSSGNNKTGVVMGGAAWTDQGKINGALQFDGVDDYVEVIKENLENSPDLNVDHLTMAAWLKQRQETGFRRFAICKLNSYTMGIADRGYGGGHEDYLNLLIYAHYSNGLDAGFGLPLNEWTHIAVTWDGDKARIYQDGLLVQTADLRDYKITEYGTTTTGVNANNFLRIGAGVMPYAINRPFESPVNSFDGDIDDVRIYNRPLSEVEIAALAGVDPISLGDVNEDREITMLDAILVAKAVVGIGSVNTGLADVDGSGTVTLKDAILIAQYANRVITEFPVEQ